MTVKTRIRSLKWLFKSPQQQIISLSRIYMNSFTQFKLCFTLNSTSYHLFSPPPPLSSSWSVYWQTWRPVGGRVPSERCRPESPTAGRCNWADPAGWRSEGVEWEMEEKVWMFVLLSLPPDLKAPVPSLSNLRHHYCLNTNTILFNFYSDLKSLLQESPAAQNLSHNRRSDRLKANSKSNNKYVNMLILWLQLTF